jgi:hypothetical protein
MSRYRLRQIDQSTESNGGNHVGVLQDHLGDDLDGDPSLRGVGRGVPSQMHTYVHLCENVGGLWPRL